MRKHLKDDDIKELVSTNGKRIELADAKCRGLQLRVGSRGDKTFSVVCRTKGAGPADPATGRRRAGPPQRIPIGSWPEVTIDVARIKAMEIINAAQRGVQAGSDGVAGSTPISAVIERYVNAKKRDGIRTWAKVDSELTRHVAPKFGAVRVDRITRTAVHDFLDEMVDDDLPGAAREVRKHLVNVMNWAEDRGYITTNPLRGMKRRDLVQNTDAGRALSDAELAAIWRALPEVGYPFADLVKVWMLTGQRRSDWSDAVGAEIDEEKRQFEVPARRYKGERDHVVPISSAVRDVLNDLPLWDGGDFLFSTTDGEVPFSGFSKAKAQLDTIVRRSLPDLKDWRIHDLRVTCKTRLAKLGIAPDVRDAVIGHAKQGLDRIYDKHDRLEEKRDALERYAHHILGVVRTLR